MTRSSRSASNEASSGRDLLIEFVRRRGQMRQSLRESLRAAIQDGRLAAGTVLPSSRRLAADLGVSRGVVTDAYEQLAFEGYLEVTARAAPIVAAVFATEPATPDPHVPAWRFDLTAITPDVRHFPRRAWMRALARAVRNTPDAALEYGDHRGRIELRMALSSYLARVRGVRVDPGCIVITQGFTQALDLLGWVITTRGAQSVVMESPTHPDLRSAVEQWTLRVIGCPVDSDGLRPELLPRHHTDAVMVAPAHQFPTGAVMAPRRRLALLRWAADQDALLVEDDYDAEFRYDRNPVGSIQGLDPTRVVHIGTASKTLAPGMRLGWMSLPAHLVDEVRTRKGLADSGSPTFDQIAFAELITSGDYDRHVARARQIYRHRRDRLIRVLTQVGLDLSVRGTAAGMHILLALPDQTDDTAIAAAAAAAGVGVQALSPMHLTPNPDRGLVLGYGRLPDSQIDEAVRTLAPLIRAAVPISRRRMTGPRRTT